MLVRCLQQMYTDELHYCDYYNHCRKIPCRDPQTNLQKNHDFRLRFVCPESQLCIIQYRHPVEAISSWFELVLREPSWLERLTVRDNQKGWERFFAEKVTYWKRFVEKWVLGSQASNRMLLPYHLLVQDSESQLRRIADFVGQGKPLPEFKFEWTLKIQDIESKKRVADFRYCNREWMEEAERGVADVLEAANIPKIEV